MGKQAASDQEDYFYVDGERVRLKPARDFCAVDLNRLKADTKLHGTTERLLGEVGASTRRGVSVVQKSKIPVEVAHDLDKRGVFQPVYEYGRSLMVVLPEVRIEEARPEMQKKMRDWLDEHGAGVEINSRQARTEVRPKSGDGRDALHLANEIQEQLAPELVQARMLRVQTKP